MLEHSLNLAGFNEDTAANIQENRRRFLNLLDGDWILTSCWQVHGSAVRIVRNPEDARNDTENCDALTTQMAGILLGVKTADCVPLLVGDTRTGAVAGIHAGWRGTVAGIVMQTLLRMKEEFGSRDKLVGALLTLGKRNGDEGYKSRLAGYPLPRLLDLHDSLTKSSAAKASKPKVAAAKAPARTKKAKQKAAAGARA